LTGKVKARARITSSAADAERDFTRDTIAFGISAAAIILFVGTGGRALQQVIKAMQGLGLGPDNLLVSALLLNVALILLGWRHHRQLTNAVSHHRDAEAQAMQLADRDPLTGFLNRRSLTEAAEQLIATSTARGESVALLMADLDSFKQINDIHGHGVGDAVLQQCARRIAEILPPGSLSARIGGDEFACFVPFDSNHPEHMDMLASALIDAIAMPAQPSEAQIDITVSIGISRSGGARNNSAPDTMTIQDRAAGAVVRTMLHAADVAMYHAKRKGRNRYFWFEASMENDLRVRRELESGIRSGIPRGEFVPYYEQQIDLKTGKLTGFEMLARWNSPHFGIVGPQIFIPVAEEIGLICQMSQGLIAQALQDAKAWDAQLTLSVNISPIQFRDPWFAQKLLKLLVEANFPPKRFEIEITESCLHENVGAVRTLLASLKNQGIRISLDDFGTGYSSFSQLSELPIDSIKIDRSFVTKLNNSANSATIVRAISTMGVGLGLPIIAEGIESEEVLRELQTFGDFKGQGYLYGKPESAAETNMRLASLNLLAVPGKFAPSSATPLPVDMPDLKVRQG
jgi:diguanylate cyclase (GGDEF)-like protein